MRILSKQAVLSLCALVALRVLPFAFSLAGSNAQDAGPGKEATQVSICDLMKDLPAHHGKRVAVRGIYWQGLRQSCREQFAIGGRRWASALWLTDSALAAPTVSFKTDMVSWDKLDELVIREARAGHKEEIWVTAVGELRTVRVGKNGEVMGGFGHLGVFPAELVLERVSDVTIDKRPTYDYGELLNRPSR